MGFLWKQCEYNIILSTIYLMMTTLTWDKIANTCFLHAGHCSSNEWEYFHSSDYCSMSEQSKIIQKLRLPTREWAFTIGSARRSSPQSLNLVRARPQALTRFSISRKSREEMVHFFLSRAGELNFHFSRCSRMSRFWRKNSRSPLEIRDLEKNSLSLLEGMRFCKQILFLFSILHSISLSILVRNHS